MNISTYNGTITNIIDLSETAKEIEVTLTSPLYFNPGSFVNVSLQIDGVTVRRAYSISSSNTNPFIISFAVRLIPQGVFSSAFWDRNMLGKSIMLMGPLGKNTAEVMKHINIYLFAFGIGAGVIKSLADHFATKEDIHHLTIMTGSRYPNEILYKDYFDHLAKTYPHVNVHYVISNNHSNTGFLNGYIQDHISTCDFNDSDIYICGQSSACNELTNKIKSMMPQNSSFHIEGFH